MKHRWMAALIILSALGCQERTETQPLSQAIQGRWQWAFAYGGHLEDTTRTLGDPEDILSFTENQFTLNEADGPVTEGSYEIGGEAHSALTGEVGPMLRLSDTPPLLFESDFVIKIQGDTLTLMSVVDDDFDHTFVRVDDR